MAKKGIKNHFSLMALLLIPIAVGINIVAYQIGHQVLKLPVFLDTIGTIMVAILAGPWVGLVTGLVTTLANAIVHPTILPFGIVAMAIGAGAGILSKLGMFQKAWKVAVSGFVIASIATIISAPILVFLFGGITGSTGSAITAAFLASGQKIWTAVFSSQFIIEITDKVISCFAAITIVKSMSARQLSKLHYGNLYIKKKK
ncbi:ECF transporter S component [Pseudalkalibacillus sp. A8]|uniref:ECF transporter S component n=1 Tax=Pseudalkalibacillus sp. A8 TaxID=3382641 RepID=UPI0038B4A376